MRNEDFEGIRRKITNLLEGWKAKLLSQSGRHTLVKHVITFIPLYSMGVGKVPMGICQEVEKLLRAFVWRRDANKRKG